LSLISVEEAQALAAAAARPCGAERVGLQQALGRVLAEDVRARADVPPHDNSAMDGYAVRAADAAGPTQLRVVDAAAAGHPARRALGPGEAIQIMTGAPIPDGADAVIMVESTERAGDVVRLAAGVTVGQHVRARGEDVRAGDRVLAAGTTLGPAELGLLASLQRASLRVARRPTVAVLSTGDELRDLDEPLGPGAIPDSNSHAIAALVRAAGGAPCVLPIVPDDKTALRAAIEEARGADLIVSMGGVSVGEHDHVKAVLAEMGATLTAWRVDMKPGKPVALASVGATPFYGLPGNPVSSMVAFHLFVRPALRTALGAQPAFDQPRVAVRLAAPLKTRSDRRQYLRARVRADGDGALVATLMPRQGSGVLSSMVGANGLVIVDAGAHELAAGTTLPALLIGSL
jgi:molybdopterin molybdotransferase